MEPSRDGTPGRGLILAVALAVFALVSFRAGKATLAEYRSASPRPEDWLRAAKLDPGNGEYWDRLGTYYEYDFDHSDLPRATEYFRQALQENPRSDLYWMHLASAYEMAGDPQKAGEAYGQAKAAYPISAEVAWNYGNFLLRQSQLEEGFKEIRRAAMTDPQLLPLAISRGWQADSDLDHLFNNLLPNSLDAYFQALDYFGSVHEDGPALETWKRIIALGQTIPLPRAFAFLDELIEQGKAGEAKEVWRQAISASGWPYTAPGNGSLVWNGEFESPIANGGLDWREDYVFGATMSIDTNTFHSGSHSLRVDFSGADNVGFHHLSQYVPVEPQSHYHFSGYLRTEDISTESGLRFVIYDPKHASEIRALTTDLIRNNPWTLLEADLATGADTHFLLITLQRDPSRLFDNKLSGTVWVDDVSLTPEKGAAKAGLYRPEDRAAGAGISDSTTGLEGSKPGSQ